MSFPKEAAAFAYVKLEDEEMSGGVALDYILPEGAIIEGEGRCCVNCALIIGRFDAEHETAFATRELRPLTEAAREMLALVA